MKRVAICFCLAAVLMLAAMARADLPAPISPVMVDADELVARLLKFRNAHPDNAEAYYRLGRVHYFMAMLKLGKIGVEDRSRSVEKPTELDAMDVLLDRFEVGKPAREPWRPIPIVTDKGAELGVDKTGKPWAGGIDLKKPDANVLWQHLNSAISNLREALRLDPKNPRYLLALACAMEDYANDEHIQGPMMENNASTSPMDARMEAMAEYKMAYDEAIKGDEKLASLPMEGLHSIISYEAGKCYPRMVKLVSPNVNPPKARELAEIGKKVAAFEKLPPAAIK